MSKSPVAASPVSPTTLLAADDGVVLNTTQARGGEGRGRSPRVLAISGALIILAFAAIYFVTMMFSANQ